MIGIQTRHLCALLGVAVISAVSLACGGNGASNNDQGMSVTFLGLFKSATLGTNNQIGGQITTGQQGCGRLPDVFLGGYIQLSQAAPEPSGETDQPITNGNSSSGTSSVGSGVDPAGGFVSIVGIQNNLYGQLFRGDRVFLDYYVPGATVQPPSTNVPIAILAGPAEAASGAAGSNTSGTTGATGSGTTTGTDLRKPIATSLPPALQNICNRALTQVTIIPPAIREWLNFNRDSLPEAPYKLEVTIRVSGLTSSGDRLETNDGTFEFDILPETFVEPTDGLETPATSETPASAIESDASGVDQLANAFDEESSIDGED